MKSGSSAGVKLWAPPSSVKFGCLVHDVQLSSSARRMCRMVRCSSIQIVTFALSVFLQMVACVSWSMRMRHAPETSAADTNLSWGPRGFHVHAWSEPHMCLHHAHFLSCASVGPRLRRVPRASMATHQEREEGGFSRENLSGENLPKKSSDLKFAREGPHPSAVTLRTISSALARA